MGSEGVSHVPIGGGSPGQDHEEQERRSDDREAEHCRLFHARIDTHLARRDNPVQPSEPEPGSFTRRPSVIDEQVTVCSRR